MENIAINLLLLKSIRLCKLVPLLVFCLLEIGCSQQLYQYSAPAEAQYYPVLNYKLIGLIEALPKPMPTMMEKVQALFNNQLHIKNENEYTVFYDGGPFITKDGVVITALDIRAGKNSKLPVEIISFSFDQKQCVSTELLKKKFGFHTLTLLSPHPMQHPPISYSVNFNRTSFGVNTTSDNKDCATGVGIGKW